MRLLPACVALLLPALASAQDDAAAGLFTEARHLPLISQSVAVDIDGDEAILRISQVFHNDGDAIGQADHRLALPTGAEVIGFGFWRGDRFLEASLQESDEAERRHADAAASGRATGIAKAAHGMTSMSVYPVGADALQQVDVTLRVPVAMEMGRRHVYVPVDRFLGQPGPSTSITVTLAADEALTGFGITDDDVVVIGREGPTATFAWSGQRPVDVWWEEDAEPLQLAVEAVALAEGDLGVSVSVALYDAGDDVARPDVLHLLIDDSASLVRRRDAVRTLVGRVEARADTPVVVHRVADASWSRLLDAWEAVGCGGAIACAVVTDPQVPGLEAADLPHGSLVLLADPDELDHFSDVVPESAMVHQPGIDPEGQLLGIADALSVPLLEVRGVASDGMWLEFLEGGVPVVPEGGMVRVYARVPELGSVVELDLDIGGVAVRRTVAVRRPGRDGGADTRRGVYRAQLVDWMRTWRGAPDEALRARIVEVSLREQIPTAFTALQVDDPELSLVSIKPGDPVLTVDDEPGLTEVVAWYPFGDLRRLQPDPASGTFSDRFLVPRHWADRSYKIEIRKHFADGSVVAEQAWYVLDDAAPDAQIHRVPGGIAVRVDPRQVADVRADGVEASVSDDGAVWLLKLPSTGRALVHVRDRAGNRSTLEVRLADGDLVVAKPAAVAEAPPVAVPVEIEELRAPKAAIEDGVVVLTVDGQAVRFPWVDAPLRSLEVTASWLDGDLWLGTAGGDLLRLTPSAAGWRVVSHHQGPEAHAITGMAPAAPGGMWVGVLGGGVWHLEGARFVRSRVDVGSRYVTGLLSAGADVLVGTAYNGLWRIVGDRGIQSVFSERLVTGLRSDGGRVLVESGVSRWERVRRDRFTRTDDGWNGLDRPDADRTDAAEAFGSLWFAAFDDGLWRDGRRESLSLDPHERRINALASHDERLWLGTEGGLLSLDAEGSLVRWTDMPVHDLDASDRGLAVAAADGAHVVVEGALSRGPVSDRGFMSVAWHRGRVVLGAMDGLFVRGAADYRALSFGVHYVSDVVSDADRLWIGTYGDGVFTMDDGPPVPVPGLGSQWVPPHGLSLLDGELWAGGIGMPPARWVEGDVTHLLVPFRDVHRVVRTADGHTWVLGSGGAARLASPG